jgi:hypothetical protein
VIIEPSPPDAPLHMMTPSEQEKCLSSMQPFITQARESFPTVRDRCDDFRSSCFVLVLLEDTAGRRQFAYLSIWHIHNDQIMGQITGTSRSLQEFKRGDWYMIPESDLFDWVIAKDEGSEEGHFVRGCSNSNP